MSETKKSVQQNANWSLKGWSGPAAHTFRSSPKHLGIVLYCWTLSAQGRNGKAMKVIEKGASLGDASGALVGGATATGNSVPSRQVDHVAVIRGEHSGWETAEA